ncbi:hypothetical protein [Brucella anthropi]
MDGILSDNFVHITQHHSLTLIPKPYEKGDGALNFTTNTLLILFWMLDMVAEIIYAEELGQLNHWVAEGEGFKYSPTMEMQKWVLSR